MYKSPNVELYKTLNLAAAHVLQIVAATPISVGCTFLILLFSLLYKCISTLHFLLQHISSILSFWSIESGYAKAKSQGVQNAKI